MPKKTLHMFGHVSPADSKLESATAARASNATNVEINHAGTIVGPHLHKACQQCGDPVKQAEPHIRADVWVDDDSGDRHLMCPVFCSEKCWDDWAGPRA